MAARKRPRRRAHSAHRPCGPRAGSAALPRSRPGHCARPGRVPSRLERRSDPGLPARGAPALRTGRGRLALVVLRRAFDRRDPALAPLDPDLVHGLQLEGRLIETSEADLDVRAVGVGCVNEPRPTAGAEAATVVARNLAAQLKCLDRPVRIHGERTAGLLSAIRAVATPDMYRVTANAVADRSAQTSAGAYSCLHARRCYDR